MLLGNCIYIYIYIYIHIQIHAHIHIYCWFGGEIAKSYFGNSKQTNSWTKWPIFCEWHIKKYLNFYYTEICYWVYKQKYGSIRSGNCVAPTRKMILWPSGYLFYRCIFCQCHWNLTQWGRVKMAALFQARLSNAFSWMKIYEFLKRFRWNMSPRVQLTINTPALVYTMAWRRPDDTWVVLDCDIKPMMHVSSNHY